MPRQKPWRSASPRRSRQPRTRRTAGWRLWTSPPPRRCGCGKRRRRCRKPSRLPRSRTSRRRRRRHTRSNLLPRRTRTALQWRRQARWRRRRRRRRSGGRCWRRRWRSCPRTRRAARRWSRCFASWRSPALLLPARARRFPTTTRQESAPPATPRSRRARSTTAITTTGSSTRRSTTPALLAPLPGSMPSTSPSRCCLEKVCRSWTPTPLSWGRRVCRSQIRRHSIRSSRWRWSAGSPPRTPSRWTNGGTGARSGRRRRRSGGLPSTSPMGKERRPRAPVPRASCSKRIWRSATRTPARSCRLTGGARLCVPLHGPTPSLAQALGDAEINSSRALTSRSPTCTTTSCCPPTPRAKCPRKTSPWAGGRLPRRTCA
mmetsp:Transcript_27895/g.56507  ORF Transcript_27895/g.56507 Transcript_27895/m.56507 type:complete len:374 (+) Transcript_27895:577-1698(+)